jgi:hypothetical protein
VYFDTHWVTDLVAGWIVGGMVLQATVLVDQVLDRQIARNTPAPVVNLADHPRSGEHPRRPDSARGR